MIDAALVLDYARQLDAPQVSHLVSAGICLWFGRRCRPRERAAFWAMSALLYAALGWAGYRWGVYGLPTSYRVPGPEPFLYKPLPGVELREIDHVLQLGLAAVFGAAALVCAWADDVLKDAVAAAKALAAAGRREPAQAESGGEL